MTGDESAAAGRPPRYADQLREIASLAQTYRERLAAHLDLNDSALRAMEWLMIDGPMTPGELATAMSLTPGAMTMIVDRLEATGHAHRERDEGDRRRVKVVPTPASVGVARAQLGPLVREVNARVGKYSDEERALVERFLDDVEESYRLGITAVGAAPDVGEADPPA